MHKLRVDEGEVGEVGLVDVGDDQLVRGGELGLRAREELVKVLRRFAALEERETGKRFGRVLRDGPIGNFQREGKKTNLLRDQQRSRVGLDLIWATSRCAPTAPQLVKTSLLNLASLSSLMAYIHTHLILTHTCSRAVLTSDYMLHISFT